MEDYLEEKRGSEVVVTQQPTKLQHGSEARVLQMERFRHGGDSCVGQEISRRSADLEAQEPGTPASSGGSIDTVSGDFSVNILDLSSFEQLYNEDSGRPGFEAAWTGVGTGG